MDVINLNGIWSCVLPDGTRVDAAVPGCFDMLTEYKDIGDTVVFERTFSLTPALNTRYFLRFGAVSYYCDVRVNGTLAGSHEGMWDSFMLDVTSLLQAGENQLRVEVIKPGYNETDRFPLRQVLSGFIPDVLHTFGGLWDDVTLEAYGSIAPEHHSARGGMDGGFCLTLHVDAKDASAATSIETWILAPDGTEVYRGTSTGNLHPGLNRIDITGTVSDPLLWGENAPHLYLYHCQLRSGTEILALTGNFGFRTFSADGSRLSLNHKPFYLRGVLHWGYYDREIIPKPSREQVKREIKSIRDYGFNAVKHCLYIPRAEYLEEADRQGIPLWIELPLWQPKNASVMAENIRREYPRILRMLSGHPSVVLISLGCELDNTVSAELLEEIYLLAKRETDALVRDNSGSGECYDGLSVEYADFFDYHFYGELQNMEHLMETFTPDWRNTKPWLFGEFCDSDTLRDLALIRKRYGVERLPWESADARINPLNRLKPDFYACHHDRRTVESGITDNYPRLTELSRLHSLVHRKTTLELTRAFPEISGYNITSLRDMPLCADGMLDDFGEPKFDTPCFREANSAVMLTPAWDLTRIWLGADRVMNRERYNFTGGSDYGLHILLSNYGGHDIGDVSVMWSLHENGTEVLSGTLSAQGGKHGQVSELCRLSFTLPGVDAPKTFALRVTASYQGGTVSNEWPVFVYPAPRPLPFAVGLYDPAGLFAGCDTLFDIRTIADEQPVDGSVEAALTSRLTPRIMEYVRAGGRALLVQRGQGVLPAVSVPFWREGMVYRDFPSFWNDLPQTHWADDLRFFSIGTDTALDIKACQALGEVSPMVRRYDCREWLASDYMCKIQIGQGELYATTLRLEGGMGKQPMFLQNNCLGRYIAERCLRGE